MHSRTRRLLTGATLLLLAVACAGLGASKAAASLETTKITKISACGYTATKAGIYELTKSVTDSGSGPCITLNGDKITLYLDSHTITGTGTDACILVEGGGTGFNVNETVLGGTMPKVVKKKKRKAKPKPMKPATLTNCGDGVVVARTSGTKVGYLNIVNPAEAGFVGILAGGMNASHIDVHVAAGVDSPGFVLSAGADNVVANSTVDYDGSQYAFHVVQETGDTFMSDSVRDTHNAAGSSGVGFYDEKSSRDTFSHCTSAGQFSGFILVPQGYGPVTATHNTATTPATGLSAKPGSYGFLVAQAYQQSDFASPFHTLIDHNKTNGFQFGFQDESAPEFAVVEKWTNNTADNYGGYGFAFEGGTDFTVTGNVADANTSGKKYTSGSTYGFFLETGGAQYAFGTFAQNQAYDSLFGFYSPAAVVGGKGNVAKRNKYNTFNVEITG